MGCYLRSTFARNGNTMVVKYQNKKEVIVLTTFYTASLVEKNPKFFGDKASVSSPSTSTVYHNTTPTYKEDFKLFILDVLDDLAAQHSKDAKALVKKDQEQIAHPYQSPQKKANSELHHCLIPFKQHKKQKPYCICSKIFGMRKDNIYQCPGCPVLQLALSSAM
ncbi:hypothetical protein E2C01_058967 [Portunus trituberculatus]|uniref:Uncharacterized protein n=1 Tax=Portunus trituberculatus TaxID=210409 RepID=A0A5B7H5K3_PORTR|nr:hypothetical protein [Portunus trituberculatus]